MIKARMRQDFTTRAVVLSFFLLFFGSFSAFAQSDYISGRIEGIRYEGLKRYLIVGGKEYLVNRHTMVSALAGKRVVTGLPLSALVTGGRIRALLSSFNGDTWIKKVEIISAAKKAPERTGSIHVPATADGK